MSQFPPSDKIRIQKIRCKDIPDLPILQFLELIRQKHIICAYYHCGALNVHAAYAGLTFPGFPSFVGHAFPDHARDQPKLILAKMGKLIAKGLITGCTCGCRGDFQITEKGIQYLTSAHVNANHNL